MPASQSFWLNAGLTALALLLSLLAIARQPLPGDNPPETQALGSELQFARLPSGEQALLDADGTAAPLKRYERIASGSMLSDRVLIELCDPQRLVAFTTYAGRSTIDGHRFSGKPQIAALEDIEALIALAPDLLLLNTHTSLAKIERLREANITVFNLGQMRGLETFDSNVRQIAHLIGHPKRAEGYLQSFGERLNRIAQTLPERERKTALYLTVLGRQLYGGAARTSHSDVLRKAGLIDVAAARFEGWPRLSTVQLLDLDPEIIVVREGGGRVLCGLPGAGSLRACQQGRQGIIEGPQDLWGGPGPMMLPAAEFLHARVYGAGTRAQAAGRLP